MVTRAHKSFVKNIKRLLEMVDKTAHKHKRIVALYYLCYFITRWNCVKVEFVALHRICSERWVATMCVFVCG